MNDFAVWIWSFVLALPVGIATMVCNDLLNRLSRRYRELKGWRALLGGFVLGFAVAILPSVGIGVIVFLLTGSPSSLIWVLVGYFAGVILYGAVKVLARRRILRPPSSSVPF